jgi:membrane-bound lytic murein transglycosylase MltF
VRAASETATNGSQASASSISTLAEARAYARAHLSALEWTCFDALVQRESRWNPLARNRKSGAFGLMQTYPAERLDSWGDRHDPMVQVRWGLGYIHGRYGTPCRALDHAITEGWY